MKHNCKGTDLLQNPRPWMCSIDVQQSDHWHACVGADACLHDVDPMAQAAIAQF